MNSDIEYFPKIVPPFEREGNYVIDSVRDGYEWVFDDAGKVKAVEKIDGENVSVVFDDGLEPVSIYRRDGAVNTGVVEDREYNMKKVPMWQSEESHYTEGIVNAYRKGWIDNLDGSGQYFGELVGPRIQGNRYDLDNHFWVPFEYASDSLVMESYGKKGTDFESIKSWFTEIGLIPLFYHKMHGGLDFDLALKRHDVEGVVFTHPNPDEIETIPYAKLRVGMFQ